MKIRAHAYACGHMAKIQMCAVLCPRAKEDENTANYKVSKIIEKTSAENYEENRVELADDETPTDRDSGFSGSNRRFKKDQSEGKDTKMEKVNAGF